jgi:signal peptidase I
MFGRGSQHEGPVDTFWHRKFGPTIGSVVVFVLEVVQIVIISAAIIIPIRYFLIQPFYVKGASMEPNFYDHEYLIIDELSYRLREPMRGEIVVFRYPRDPSQFFIKRVIGLPGETVEIEDGKITVYNGEHPNGIELDEEDYLDGRTDGKEKVTLALNEYFVMGDNRDQSLDSRDFGPIYEDDIVGRVWVRGLPLSRVGTFDVPDYNF